MIARIFQVLIVSIVASLVSFGILAQSNSQTQRVDYKVGFLGVPCHPEVEWNEVNLQRMKDLGFNVLQLNIAWGYRHIQYYNRGLIKEFASIYEIYTTIHV